MDDIQVETNAYYYVIDRACNQGVFNGGHAVFTPRAIVEQVLDKIQLDGNILVMFNIEFVVSLVYTYKVDPKKIRFYSDHTNKNKICDQLGVKYMNSLETDMKFDYGLTNPPYTNGIWRKIVKQLMKVTDRIALVSPDDRVPQGAQAKNNLAEYVEFGLQNIEDASIHFPKVNAGAPIVVYYLDKNQKTNQSIIIANDVDTATQRRILKSIQISPVSTNRRFVRGLIQATPKKNGQLDIEFSSTPTADLNIKIITNVRDNGSVIEGYTNTDKSSFPTNRGRTFTGRLFIFNRHFSRNLDPYIHEVSSAAGIKFGNNIMAYDAKPTDTVDGFKSVYMSNLYRFALAVQRGSEPGIRDAYLNCLPLLDLSRVWTNKDLYDHFNISSEDRDYINNFISNMK